MASAGNRPRRSTSPACSAATSRARSNAFEAFSPGALSPSSMAVCGALIVESAAGPTMSAPQTAIELGLSAPGLNASKAFERALEVAAEHAGDVDRRGRFPAEAIDALRSAGALGWGIPIAYGG